MGQLLARISRRTITKHRDYNPQVTDRDSRHLDAVRDWRFSEAVEIGLLRLVLRRAGGTSARHRPTKVCDWVQVRWPRSRASGKHCAKTGSIFAIFQMSSNFSNFPVRSSILLSLFKSDHLSRSLRPVFGKTIAKHVSRIQKNKRKKSDNLNKNIFLKKLKVLTSLVCFRLIFRQCYTFSLQSFSP